MKESAKAGVRRAKDHLWQRALTGVGIDIGCGDDPVSQEMFPGITSVDTFDIKDGDANYILQYRTPGSYDFVYSSHCLEHLVNPAEALRQWFGLLRVGGYLAVTIPDEDLYEQGVWPSKNNGDHKHTFTISKQTSWSPKSINVIELLRDSLPDGKVWDIRLSDLNYDHAIKGQDQTLGHAEANLEFIVQKLTDKNYELSHSGDMGDLIAAMAALVQRKKSRLWLYPSNRTTKKMNQEHATKIIPFLETQPYLDQVGWSSKPVGKNLDDWRVTGSAGPVHNIAGRHCALLGMDAWPSESQWLYVPQEQKVAKVIVHRSPRYRNHAFEDSWKKIREQYLGEMAFVGLKQEHDDFCERFGHVPHHQTKDYLDLAQVINGCCLYVGNQSSPFWIAEGLKKPLILEAAPFPQNCRFLRPGHIYGDCRRRHSQLLDLPTKDDLEKWSALMMSGVTFLR